MKADEEELDLDERSLLRQGYGELVPTDAEKAFALGALSVRLPGVFSALAPDASVGLGGGGASGVTALKLAASGLLLGALGFGLGVAVTRPPAQGARDDVVPGLTVTQAAPSVDAAAAPGVGVALSELELEAQEEPAVPQTKGADALSGVQRDLPPPKSPAAELTFYEELSHIRRAQTALAGGNPALALGLMRSLDEQYAAGALLAERGMTEVLALCALKRDDEARAVAARVRTRADGSMYVARLDKTCAAVPVDSGDDEPRAPTSTDQSSRRSE